MRHRFHAGVGQKRIHYGSVTNPQESAAESGNAATPEVRKEWDTLAEKVRHHRDLYYNAQPVISDAEFDELFQALQRLEEKYPQLKVPESPTVEVGAPTPESSAFADVEHPQQMYSLDNVFSPEEMSD